MDKTFVAFISYRHNSNLPFAERLARSLRTYAKSWFRPPLRIFRDEEYLLPNESLPKAIRVALENSKFLVLLASREAAHSVWVADELEIWCAELGRSNRLLIVLTEGEISFDPDTKRLDWTSTTALPTLLSRHLCEVPLYVDLRWINDERQLDLSNAEFKKEINRLVAALNEVDPERMLNTEVIVHRRNVWMARVAMIALAVLAALAVTGFLIARTALVNEREARKRAEAEAQAADANLLATRAQQASAQSPQVSVLLAAEAMQRLLKNNQPVTTATAQTMTNVLKGISGIGLRGHRQEPIPGLLTGDRNNGTVISAIAISPDSKWIATGDTDGNVLLRLRAHPDQWTELRHRDPNGPGVQRQDIQSLEFSGDSTRLAASGPGDVGVWDIAAAHPREIPLCGGGNDLIHEIHFVDDPRWIVIVGSAGIRVCNTDPSQPQTITLPEHDNLYGLVMAMNGELVVSPKGHVWCWRDQKLIKTLPGFDGDFTSVTVSQQGDKIAAGSTDGKVHVWWLDTAAHRIYEAGGLVTGVAFGPDGNSLAAASTNRSAQIWDLTGKHKPLTFVHPDEVRAIVFHPSGRTVATLSRDKRVRVWSTDWDHTPPPVELRGIAGIDGVFRLTFAADGTFLVGAGTEPIARLWLLSSLNPGLDVLPGNQSSGFESVAVNVRSRKIAAVAITGPEIWDLDHPDESAIALYDVQNHGTELALSANGRWLATSGLSTLPYLWNLATPLREPRRLLPSAGSYKPAFSPDSSLVAGMREDGSIVLESTSDASVSPIILSGLPEPAVDFAFSPDGSHLAAICRNGTALIWDVHTRAHEQIAGSSERREAMVVAFSRDGHHVALAGVSFVDWIDLASHTSRRLAAPPEQHLTKIAIAPDAQRVAAGTNKGLTLIWDASSDTPPRTLPGHTDEVVDLAFSPDGDALASAAENAIRIWSVHDTSVASLRLDPNNVRVINPTKFGDSSSISKIVYLNNRQIAASTTGGVVVWDLDWTRLIARACETAGRSLSPDEIADYLDGRPVTACVSAAKPR